MPAASTASAAALSDETFRSRRRRPTMREVATPAGVSLATVSLFASIDGDRGPSRRVIVPTMLVERGSGELVPS